MAGGAVEMLLVSLSCPLPLLRIHPHPLLVFFCGDGSDHFSIWTAGVKSVNVREAEWKEPLR